MSDLSFKAQSKANSKSLLAAKNDINVFRGLKNLVQL